MRLRILLALLSLGLGLFTLARELEQASADDRRAQAFSAAPDAGSAGLPLLPLPVQR